MGLKGTAGAFSRQGILLGACTMIPAITRAVTCVMHMIDSREFGKHTKYSYQPQPLATEHACQVTLLCAEAHAGVSTSESCPFPCGLLQPARLLIQKLCRGKDCLSQLEHTFLSCLLCLPGPHRRSLISTANSWIRVLPLKNLQQADWPVSEQRVYIGKQVVLPVEQI